MNEKPQLPFLWALWLIPILGFGLALSTLSDLDVTRDWLSREGHYVLIWWGLTTLAGIGTFPLLYRLLPGLSDRGYTLARTAGLMLTGFVFWFMASTGLMRNEPGAIVTAWLLVAGTGIFAWFQWEKRPTRQELKDWWNEHLPLIIITEVLFIVAFLGWAFVRAHNPELNTTEKPMEMAFINGIRNSETFPPDDPWLSGYSISYYYFGYVITASLADLSAMPTGSAFSLVNALLFALTAIGALGVTYNLIRAARNHWQHATRSAAIGTGLLAASMLVLSGNLTTALVELPYRGYTSSIMVLDDVVDEDYFNFWDIQSLSRFYEVRAQFSSNRTPTDSAYPYSVKLTLYPGGNLETLLVEQPSQESVVPRLDVTDGTYDLTLAYTDDPARNATLNRVLEHYVGEVPDNNNNDVPDRVEYGINYTLLRLYPNGDIFAEPALEGGPLEHYIPIPDRDADGIPSWDDESITMKSTFSWRFWWWFQHSRIVRDQNLEGTPRGAEPIVEFPQFSFVLSDNHPHVLALPFAVMIIGLASGLALRGATPLKFPELLLYAILAGGMLFMNAWDGLYLVIIIGAEVLRRLLWNNGSGLIGFMQLGSIVTLEYRQQWNLYLVAPVFAGTLLLLLIANLFSISGLAGFIFYLIMALLITFLLTPLVNWLLDDNDWAGIFRFAILLGILSYLLYLPWMTSFTSQANGFFPNVINPTRSQQFFLQFGIFLIPIVIFLIQQAGHASKQISWLWLILYTGLSLGIITILPIFSSIVVDSVCPLTIQDERYWNSEELTEFQRNMCETREKIYGTPADPNATTDILGMEVYGDGIEQVFERRTTAFISEFIVFLSVAFIGLRLFARRRPYDEKDEDEDNSPDAATPEAQRPAYNYSPGTGVALLLIAAGLVLAILPDFIYLRDGFGTRINTIFKLYFQAWTLLSIGSAFAVFSILNGVLQHHQDPRTPVRIPVLVGRGVFALIMSLLVIGGLLYPYFALQSRYQYENNRVILDENGEKTTSASLRPLTLNGEPGITEYELAQCLKAREPRPADVIIAEAPGQPYQSQTSRISMLTGFQTILGWGGHERQWRGDTFEQVITVAGQSRTELLRQLYTDDPTLAPADEWRRDQEIIDLLEIDYIVYGQHEFSTYGTDPQKFAELLEPVCSQGTSVIYYVAR